MKVTCTVLLPYLEIYSIGVHKYLTSQHRKVLLFALTFNCIQRFFEASFLFCTTFFCYFGTFLTNIKNGKRCNLFKQRYVFMCSYLLVKIALFRFDMVVLILDVRAGADTRVRKVRSCKPSILRKKSQ